MSHTPLFQNLVRAFRVALYCEKEKISTAEGLERIAEAEDQAAKHHVKRREFLANIGRVAVAGAFASATGPAAKAFTTMIGSSNVSVGIVGAGIAGLACADELKRSRHGIDATLYEASARTGGRIFSLGNFFPGQVGERGGEFIDNLHKTMLGYARRFNLEMEDVNRRPGEVFYYFNGQHYPESVVVDEYRDFVQVMRVDLRTLSGEVTADNHTETDARIDQTNLLEYLEGSNGAGVPAGPIAKQAIIQAYQAEFGLAPDEVSCLNFLLFIHADRRSKFTPFGIFSDERWHVVEGNDKITQRLSDSLPGQIRLGMQLIRIRRTSSGGIELTFNNGTTTVTRIHDTVVLAIPFTTLRDVELDANLGLPPEKQNAINLLGYGTNAKMILGFTSRPWVSQGSNGTSYSDLPNHQMTWETNHTRATATRAVLTDYSSAERGALLDPNAVQAEAAHFLTDLDRVYPGAYAAASRTNGNFLAHIEHWPSNPFAKGSYTCYRPGQFTTIAGNEGKAVGNLHFAGEHANSFYEWQGFMEGAALSGIQAAKEILRDIRVGLV